MAVTIKTFTRASELSHGISGDDDNRDVAFWAVLSEPVADEFSDFGDKLIRLHVNANAPILWDGLPRGNISLQQITPVRFLVTVHYTKNKSDDQKATAGVKLSFEVTTNNHKVTVAQSQIGWPTAVTDTYKKFINVVHDDDKVKVEGVDFPFPEQEFSYTYTADRVFFTDEYLRRCRLMVTRINSFTFFTNPPGSVMFSGLRGTVENTGSSELTYLFKYRQNPNTTAEQDIAGVTIPIGADIWGWDVMWTKFAPEATNVAQLSTVAEGVYRARVGKAFDLGWLLIDPSHIPGGSWADPT